MSADGERRLGGLILAGNNSLLEYSVIVDSAGDGVSVTGQHVTVNNNLIHDVDYAAVDAAPIRIGGRLAPALPSILAQVQFV